VTGKVPSLYEEGKWEAKEGGWGKIFQHRKTQKVCHAKGSRGGSKKGKKITRLSLREGGIGPKNKNWGNKSDIFALTEREGKKLRGEKGEVIRYVLVWGSS